MAVYADILLLVNFSMDFLSLYLTARLLHKPVRKNRFVFSAITGCTAGTAWTLLPVESAAVVSVIAGFIISLIMTWVAFGKNTITGLIRDILAVWGAGILLGGVMTCVLSLGEPVYVETNRHTRAFLPAFAVCFLIASVLIRMFTAARSGRSACVTVVSQGIVSRFHVLCDSGSFAADPMSGKPVILVRKGVLRELEDNLFSDDCTLRLRMIPVDGIGGSRVLRGFVPDGVMVDNTPGDAVIAIYNEDKSFAGFDGILPAALCRSGNDL